MLLMEVPVLPRGGHLGVAPCGDRPVKHLPFLFTAIVHWDSSDSQVDELEAGLLIN